jgi:hypothetical protein
VHGERGVSPAAAPDQTTIKQSRSMQPMRWFIFLIPIIFY